MLERGCVLVFLSAASAACWASFDLHAFIWWCFELLAFILSISWLECGCICVEQLDFHAWTWLCVGTVGFPQCPLGYMLSQLWCARLYSVMLWTACFYPFYFLAWMWLYQYVICAESLDLHTWTWLSVLNWLLFSLPLQLHVRPALICTLGLCAWMWLCVKVPGLCTWMWLYVKVPGLCTWMWLCVKVPGLCTWMWLYVKVPGLCTWMWLYVKVPGLCTWMWLCVIVPGLCAWMWLCVKVPGLCTWMWLYIKYVKLLGLCTWMWLCVELLELYTWMWTMCWGAWSQQHKYVCA